jgi:(p)ppGpp synthase/HD superfamily hydrolase
MNPKVIAFAISSHAETNHLYDGQPYSVHLAMVVSYIYKYLHLIPPYLHNVTIEAGWLHDTIEDTRKTFNDIKEVGGLQVADIVYALTNDKGRNRKERAGENYYKGIRETGGATFVKLCDRLANVSYSKTTQSKMFSVYQKENEGFISCLFPDGNPNGYEPMVDELRVLVA